MNTVKTPLYIRPDGHQPENPFAGDLFARRQLAIRLTGLVERLSDGCVMAIDAPWGEGKSWFGLNWASDLRSQGFSVAYIDAFRQDYVDDPFLMVCSEIITVISDKDGAKTKIKEAGRLVAKALLPVVAKAAVNFGGRVLLGASDLSGDILKSAEEVDKGVADAIEKGLATRLDEHAKDKQSVEGFANVLGEYARSLDKPLIVFVDELDRCRPDFAVKTIERIKHFFDVPRVVFVLLVNRPQLEAAVRGIYGSDVEAGAYLGKFVQFWLGLPKVRNLDTLAHDHNQIYSVVLARRFGLQNQKGCAAFQETIAMLATISGMSLRDLERGYTLFSLAQPLDNETECCFVAWAAFIKLTYPATYADILSNQPSAHIEVGKIISSLIAQSKGLWILPILSDLHNSMVTEGQAPPLKVETQDVLSSLGRWRSNPGRFLKWFYERVELRVDN